MDNRSIFLAANYQQIYHMAEAGTVDSIRRRGLLSTAALLDMCGISGDSRIAIESQVRRTSVTLALAEDEFTIRDQRPMNEAKLAGILDDCTPAQWCQLLNRHVFFWPTKKRLERLLAAREYRDRAHDVLVVSTRRLLERHANRVRLTPMNTGATIYNPLRRGRHTFASIDAFPLQERFKTHGVPDAVVEFAVEYSVPDIADFIICTERWVGPRVVSSQ